MEVNALKTVSFEPDYDLPDISKTVLIIVITVWRHLATLSQLMEPDSPQIQLLHDDK